MIAYTYSFQYFSTKYTTVLFNKKRTKTKYRKLIYKDITLDFKIKKQQSFYSFTNILNSIPVDNYIEKQIAYHSLPFRESYINQKLKSLSSFYSASYGMSFSFFLRLVKPFFILPLEITNILKSCIGNSYFKLHLNTGYSHLMMEDFFVCNTFPRYKFPFTNYDF